MPHFCETCKNLLKNITSSDNFYFKCNSCNKNYQPSDEDSIRYNDIKGTNLIVYKTILQTAGKDPVNPKVYLDCPKCKNNIVKQVRIGEDMRIINTCVECDHRWLLIEN